MSSILAPVILICTGLCAVFCGGAAAHAATVLVEAESFTDPGGWTLDTQFIDTMGSPYLLAHGLGKPVADAVTKVSIPAAGDYRVFVRTKDWVARWKAPGTPGRFEVVINGTPLPETFGTMGIDWNWQAGGTVKLLAGEATIGLHDLTGFDGNYEEFGDAKKEQIIRAEPAIVTAGVSADAFGPAAGHE